MPIIHTPLPENERTVAVAALQALLVDLCAYDFVVQQNRWSVVGTGAHDLSVRLDDCRHEIHQAQQRVAGRLCVLDAPGAWRPASSPIATPVEGWCEVTTAVESLLHAASVCVMRVRDRLSAVFAADPVTASVVTEILGMLEFQAFQWQSAGATWTSRGMHGS